MQGDFDSEKEIFEFGEYRLDIGEHRLERLDGKPAPLLQQRAFETLALLVRNNGHLLTKSELMQKLWPNSFVEDNNLEKNIHLIRHALDEKPGDNRYIETVRKNGYRFVAEVRLRKAGDDPQLTGSAPAPQLRQNRRYFLLKLLALVSMLASIAYLMSFALER